MYLLSTIICISLERQCRLNTVITMTDWAYESPGVDVNRPTAVTYREKGFYWHGSQCSLWHDMTGIQTHNTPGMNTSDEKGTSDFFVHKYVSALLWRIRDTLIYLRPHTPPSYLHLNTSAHTQTENYIYLLINIFTHTHTHSLSHTHTHMYTHTHTHTNTHTYTLSLSLSLSLSHTHTHTHTHTRTKTHPFPAFWLSQHLPCLLPTIKKSIFNLKHELHLAQDIKLRSKKKNTFIWSPVYSSKSHKCTTHFCPTTQPCPSDIYHPPLSSQHSSAVDTCREEKQRTAGPVCTTR